MDLATIRDALLYCTIFNYILLIIWALWATVAKKGMYSMLEKCFRATPQQVDTLNLYGISIYKCMIIVFNLIPWISLMIVLKK